VCGFACQVIEQVAEIDIGAFAERHHQREADAPRLRPVQDRGDERAGLRDEGDVAGECVGVRKGGVQADVRRQQADAVRSEDPQQEWPGGVERHLLLRCAEPGGHHDRGARPEPAELGDQLGHCRRGRADDREVGNLRQIVHPGVDDLAVERRVARIDCEDRARVSARAEVAPHGGADAAGAVRGADDDDRLRLEESVEVANAHGIQGLAAGKPEGR
jgi:hypothetical protein